MYANGEFYAYTIGSMGYAYTGKLARVMHIDRRRNRLTNDEGSKMSYGETVLAVCAGTAAFVCLGVAAAYAAAWILDGIDHK